MSLSINELLIGNSELTIWLNSRKPNVFTVFQAISFYDSITLRDDLQDTIFWNKNSQCQRSK